MIKNLNIEGDLVIKNKFDTIYPQGWGRLRWAWHALRGRPFHSPHPLVITECEIGKKLEVQGGGVTWKPINLQPGEYERSPDDY